MAANHGLIQRAAAPFAGLVNRARLGFPRRFFQGTGTPGGDLATTVVYREIKKRGNRGVAFATPHPALFERNHDIDEIIPCRDANADGWLHQACLSYDWANSNMTRCAMPMNRPPNTS